MTTDELRAIAEAAKARQADITPAPWAQDGNGVHSQDGSEVIWYGASGRVNFSRKSDVSLITAAPDLNAAVVELWERLQAAQGVGAWEVD